MRFISWLSGKKIKGKVMNSFSVGIAEKDRSKARPLIMLKETENGLVLEINDSMAKKLGITVSHKNVI